MNLIKYFLIIFLIKLISSSETETINDDNKISTPYKTTTNTETVKSVSPSLSYPNFYNSNNQQQGTLYVNQPPIPVVKHTSNFYQKQQQLQPQTQKYEAVDTNYNTYNHNLVDDLRNDVASLKDNIQLLAGMQSSLLENIKTNNEQLHESKKYENIKPTDNKEYKEGKVEEHSNPSKIDTQYQIQPEEHTSTSRTFHHHRPLFIAQPVVPTMSQPVQPIRTIQPAIKSFRPIPPRRRIIISPNRGRGLHGLNTGRKLSRGRKVVKSKDSRSIVSAQNAIESIRKGFMSALWTGLIVVAVKFIPLFKILFKGFLPLMGLAFTKKDAENEMSLSLEDEDLDEEFEDEDRDFFDGREEEVVFEEPTAHHGFY